jgi:Meiotically up-regulated gene 113
MAWTENYKTDFHGMIVGDFPGGVKLCLSLHHEATRQAIARKDLALLDYLAAMLDVADSIAPERDNDYWGGASFSGPRRPGFIYLLQSTENSHIYKIGLSTDVSRRIKQIGNCRHVHSFPADDTLAAESRLHKFYAAQRQEGEWFYLHEPNIDFIRSISRYQDGEFLNDEIEDLLRPLND